jgi:D-tyrosyl-tRNA(Tyr) deacylase
VKVIIQRVDSCIVHIDKKPYSSIEKGFLVLLGITHDDTQKDIEMMVKKICNLRIFNDSDGKMKYSVIDTKGSIMIVSQFTLYADTKKGNRPSFLEAAEPQKARLIYEDFMKYIRQHVELKITSGVFGADMKLEINNNGPVTIILDSKEFYN